MFDLPRELITECKLANVKRFECWRFTLMKVLLMTFKIINGCAPEYLSDLLEMYVPACSLRSATQGLLVVPKSFTSTHGDRGFSVVVPKLWNNLPTNIRTTSALDSFKSKLKTHLFQDAFLWHFFFSIC